MSKEIIVNETKITCQHCSGTGEVERDSSISCPKIYKRTACKRCGGKGYYIDKTYYHVSGNICFGGDTLK